MKVSEYAKALYACVMAALGAAQAIYVHNVLLTIVIAALIPLGVYRVRNKPAEIDLANGVDKREPLL